ncbi:adenosine kinase [Beijerinckia indica]|uniref:PfkB domain protein n=1 Tax=Beijerinckia indica subsp. indica (strain ATCC 9039 / DSM 1715 / NCIMB 8712) TaxID=395963 RepID=B2ICI2_BEII9|nr:adenosine kinase [Beijerinckia indica]ACB93871.1 PfkB domain protein [Beijerinckia indica subsp. indica ATCC 9039]
MASPTLDLLGFGNAIVDVLGQVDDDFLLAQGLHKGSMTLIDEARATSLYGAMGPVTVVSGGSAANTIIGAAGLGCKTGFVGKLKSDPLGTQFAHDIRGAKVAFTTSFAEDGPASATCLVLVTPDGQRTMNTYLGASANLTEADVDAEQVQSAAIIYLEGYLWDPPAAKAAFLKASRIARDAGRQVALTLSDTFCVDRYREEFLGLIRDKSVQILFANESELHALYQTSDFDTAIAALRQENILGVVTRSEHGSVVVTSENVLAVPAFPVDQVVDTTGAGDLFAGGFLTGLSKNKDHSTAARLGALAAAEIIQHIGARPQKDLAYLARQNGFDL